MDMRLKTKLKVYPKIKSSTILDNFVTKDDLERDYVSKNELNNILKSFVLDVQNPELGKVYGRKLVNGSMMWIEIIAGESQSTDLLLYGISPSEELSADEALTLQRIDLDSGVTQYEIEYTPFRSGYFYFLCTQPIVEIKAISGLEYTQEVIDQPDITLNISGMDVILHCYRTPNKLVALDGVKNRFRISL